MFRAGRKGFFAWMLMFLLSMVFGTFEGLAEEPSQAKIKAGASVLSKGSIVWFGGESEATPLSGGWLVLNTEADSALLIANGTQFGVTGFCTTDRIWNEWDSSTIRDRCIGLYENWPSAIEKANINSTTITDDVGDGRFKPCQINNEHFYILSHHEMQKLFDMDAKEYVLEDSSGTHPWWLRSASKTDGKFAAMVVKYQDSVESMQKDNGAVLRPAFSLKLTDVLFVSAAEGGKPDAGQLTAVSTEDVNAATGWKLTFRDSSRKFAAAEKSVIAGRGGSVSIPYTGAVTGSDEYVSLMIVKGDAILYYACAKVTAADGTAEFELPDDLPLGSYTARIFNEKKMPDHMSDYASEPQDIVINVKEPISAAVTFKVVNGSWDSGTDADQKVALTGVEGDVLKLAADQIPAVGKKPADGYEAGSWDTVPDTNTAITKDAVYTYTYQKSREEAPKETEPIETEVKEAEPKEPEVKQPETREPEVKETEADQTEPAKDKSTASAAKEKTLLNLTGAVSGSKIVLKWNRIKEASYYKVYGAYCGEKLKLRKTIRNNKTTKVIFAKLNGKKLNLKKEWKFLVIAYQKTGGKTKKIAQSIGIHFVGKKNAAYTNASAVKVKKSSIRLAKGKTAQLKPSLVLVDKKKKILGSVHAPKFRYVSTNKSVAKVSSSGKITARKAGKCTIYVYAINGRSAKVRVTVR